MNKKLLYQYHHKSLKSTKYLAKEGYNTITPSEMMNALEYGTPLPEKPIMITFDDGYLDNYTNAYPDLKNMDLPQRFFL